MPDYIDLRSDTVTKPTPEMREAMARAEVGDDCYSEDPTVNRLQEMAAGILGKEAALLVPSGTMANLLSLKLNSQAGQEAIVDERSHIYNYEMASGAVTAGLQLHPVSGGASLTWGGIQAAIRPHSTHFARTAVIALENTLNLAGGLVLRLDVMNEICDRAHERGIRTHLDGARIFNAAVALGVSPADLAAPFDTVMFCLSKGLSAPIGSLVAGSSHDIERAIPIRRMLGGAMRQAGVIAAAGIVALEKMVGRLPIDHQNARILAEGLSSIPGLEVDPETVVTNIVVFDVPTAAQCDSEEFLARLKAQGVLAVTLGPLTIRMVTHKDVDRAGCIEAVAATRRALGLN